MRTFTKPIKRGEKGPHVKEIQEKLIQLNFVTVLVEGKVKTLKADEDYGAITESAVESFQAKVLDAVSTKYIPEDIRKQYKLEVNGIVDYPTWFILENYNKLSQWYNEQIKGETYEIEPVVTSSDIIKTFIEVISKEVGVVEKGGNNMGARVQEYQKVGSCSSISGGSPWCQYFQNWAIKETLKKLDIKISKTLSDVICDGYTPDWVNYSKKHNNAGISWPSKISQIPIGALGYVYSSARKNAKHVFAIYGTTKSGSVATIEGNAQPLFSKVLTPTGWKLMKDIKIGDKLINPEGFDSEVKGIYYQGILDYYKITLSDGSSTFATSDHLWKIKSRNKNFYKIVNTAYIQNRLGKTKRGISIATITNKFDLVSNKEITIDPYVLGLLIGDGNLTKNIKFTTGDSELLENIKNIYPDCNFNKINRYDYQIVTPDYSNNYILDYLKSLDLIGKCSYEKFIPENYKLGSYKTRLNLLQGLMDTDGSVDKLGRMEFTSTSKQLTKDVLFLIKSLGGKASFEIRNNITYTSPSRKTKKIAKTAYRLNNIRFESIVPFKLTRKVDKVHFNQNKDILYVRSIEHIGKTECQCIKVSAPNQLYITDDFIVTHNTNPGGGSDGYGVFKRVRSLGNQCFHVVKWWEYLS